LAQATVAQDRSWFEELRRPPSSPSICFDSPAQVGAMEKAIIRRIGIISRSVQGPVICGAAAMSMS